MSNEKINLEDLAHEILVGLNQKQQDVIKKRFAIQLSEAYTLQKIGDEYEITRERVRQIQNEALNKLRRNEDVTKNIKILHDQLHDFLREHGGLKHEDKLLRSFLDLYKNLNDKEHYQGFIHLILHLGHPLFKNNKEDDNCFAYWFNDDKAIKKSSFLIDKMQERFKQAKTIFSYNELIKEAKKILPGIDEKPIISYLEISKNIGSSLFNYWGLADWEEIKQRGVRGKIYIILENEQKPMHFQEIARLINKYYSKKVQVPTIHNELIKDDRFVLAGRGIYALKKWGYDDAPVRDVIIKILKEHHGKLLKSKLIEEVLKKKLVKKETVKINLKNIKNLKEKDDLVLLKS